MRNHVKFRVILSSFDCATSVLKFRGTATIGEAKTLILAINSELGSFNFIICIHFICGDLLDFIAFLQLWSMMGGHRARLHLYDLVHSY